MTGFYRVLLGFTGFYLNIFFFFFFLLFEIGSQPNAIVFFLFFSFFFVVNFFFFFWVHFFCCFIFATDVDPQRPFFLFIFFGCCCCCFVLIFAVAALIRDSSWCNYFLSRLFTTDFRSTSSAPLRVSPFLLPFFSSLHFFFFFSFTFLFFLKWKRIFTEFYFFHWTSIVSFILPQLLDHKRWWCFT